jgi:hypothetical protein
VFFSDHKTLLSESMLHLHGANPMVNMLILAAGAVVALATALVARRHRKSYGSSTASVGPVSEEWLSNVRGQGDHSW